jgi:hypothetical protein
MKNEVCELSVRLRLLDEAVEDGSSFSGIPDLKETNTEKHVKHFEDTEIDLSDHVAVRRLQERLQEQSFRSYYKACQKMVNCEGSGACRKGFQAGFKPSFVEAFFCLFVLQIWM